MDQQESTTLAAVFTQVPGPRKRRGQCYPWPFIWTLIATALLSEQRTPHAIAHWVSLHAPELVRHLQPPHAHVPSESTFRRALRHIGLTDLEHRLVQVTPAGVLPATPPPPGLADAGATTARPPRAAHPALARVPIHGTGSADRLTMDQPIVVVVENHEDTSDILCELLLFRGYHAVPCLDGATAHACIVAAQPQLVILDIWLPGPDGMEVFRQLRADDATSAIPIIFFTGARARLPVGAPVVRKPFFKALLWHVEQLLGPR